MCKKEIEIYKRKKEKSMRTFMNEQRVQMLKELDELIRRAESILKSAPEGSLRVIKNHNTSQYYWKNSKTGNQGKYIRKSNKELIENLAQKEYIEKILPVLEEKRDALMECDQLCDWSIIEEIQKKIQQSKKTFIVPIRLNDDDYAKEWMSKMANSMTQMKGQLLNKYPLNEDTGIMTEKGELVRSKSEKIIADKLFMMKIPYIYELPLYMKKTGYIYPDFTVLNIQQRKVMYWEHFGLMNREEYCESAIKKIRLYEKNHMYQGQQLITTYETPNQLLDTEILQGIIKEYLK